MLLASCQKDPPFPIEPDPCGATPLGITQAAIHMYPEFAIETTDSAWSWRRTDDSLFLRFLIGGFCTSHSRRYLKFEITDCIRLVRDYTYTTDVALSTTPIVNISESDYELNFELQEWGEGQILIGKNGDTEFWVDFNADNKY